MMKFIFITFSILICFDLSYAATFEILDNHSVHFTGDSFYIKNTSSIEEALINVEQGKFEKLTRMNKIYSSKAEWFLFSIKNLSQSKVEKVIQYPYACTDEILYYEIHNMNVIETTKLSSSTYIYDRSFYSRRLSLKTVLNPGEEKTFVVRMKSRHILGVHFDISSPIEAKKYEDKYKVYSILYTGIAIGLFFYNLFVALSSKNESIFFYLTLLVSISLLILFVADVPAYFGIQTPLVFHYTLPLHHTLVIFFSCFFSMSFLKTKFRYPKIHNTLKSLALFSLSLGIISLTNIFFNPVNLIIMNLMTVMLVLSIVSGSYIWLDSKSRPSFIYILGMGVLFISGLCYMLTWNYQLLPRNFFTANIILLGSALEMILFSIAIADNFKYSISRELSKRLKAEELLKKLNSELELKVIQKSKEIMDIQKRAALGEMAGSVAHELNSPLSAVYNYNQRISKLLNKDELDSDKLKTTALKIDSVLNQIFEITNNLQIYSDDYDNYEVSMYNIKDLFDKALQKFKELEANVEIKKVRIPSKVIKCKEVPTVNSILALIKYTSLNSTVLNIFVNEQFDKKITIDFSSDGEALPLWVGNYIQDAFHQHKGEVKGSGLELSILKDTFDSLDISILFGGIEDSFKFRIIFNS